MRQTVHEFWLGDKYCYAIFQEGVIVELGWFSRADGHGDPKEFQVKSDIIEAVQALRKSLKACAEANYGYGE